jgi:hypothetical protein
MEVKPTLCRDRNLNRLGLGFRLTYLADLETKSPKLKLQNEAAPPQGEGPDFGGPFTQVPRGLRPARCGVRAYGVYLPSSIT